jgi:undecaprenyl-diphosphatase
MGAIDAGLLYIINRTISSYHLNILMLFISYVGSNELLLLVALILLLSAKRETRISGVLLLAGLTVSYHVVSLLKNWIGRPRPFVSVAGINAMERADGFSFPSGHAAAAFVAAVILIPAFGRSWLFLGLAGLVAVSRVYLGVHFPSDVLAGALLGAALGWILVNRVREKTL